MSFCKSPPINRVLHVLKRTGKSKATLWLFFLFFSLGAEAAVENLIPVVIRAIPHPLPAFTQGLAVDEGWLIESTGLYGKSSLRVLNAHSGNIERSLSLPRTLFAEGIAVFSDRVILLTWKEHTAFVFEKESFRQRTGYRYCGEGWGLCRDGDTVWMSNGSSTLFNRDASSFSVLKTIEVKNGTASIVHLNDLECVGDELYANIWPTDEIVRIDKLTGEVKAIIDASSLASWRGSVKTNSDAVLNGIAYDPIKKTFFVTGKEWPWIYEVRFAHPGEFKNTP